MWGDGERVYYQGELERLDYGEGIAFTYRFVGFGFDEPTRVEVDLLPRGETVLVSLRHDCRSAPRTARIIGPVGWQKALSRLKTLLETGRSMPWPEDGPKDDDEVEGPGI